MMKNSCFFMYNFSYSFPPKYINKRSMKKAKKFANFSSLYPRSSNKMFSVQPCGTLITVCLAVAHSHSPSLLRKDD